MCDVHACRWVLHVRVGTIVMRDGESVGSCRHDLHSHMRVGTKMVREGGYNSDERRCNSGVGSSMICIHTWG
jgi:hypothetical protein